PPPDRRDGRGDRPAGPADAQGDRAALLLGAPVRIGPVGARPPAGGRRRRREPRSALPATGKRTRSRADPRFPRPGGEAGTVRSAPSPGRPGRPVGGARAPSPVDLGVVAVAKPIETATAPISEGRAYRMRVGPRGRNGISRRGGRRSPP